MLVFILFFLKKKTFNVQLFVNVWTGKFISTTLWFDSWRRQCAVQRRRFSVCGARAAVSMAGVVAGMVLLGRGCVYATAVRCRRHSSDTGRCTTKRCVGVVLSFVPSVESLIQCLLLCVCVCVRVVASVGWAMSVCATAGAGAAVGEKRVEATRDAWHRSVFDGAAPVGSLYPHLYMAWHLARTEVYIYIFFFVKYFFFFFFQKKFFFNI